jgi:putative sigma-54 modulation protein
MNVNITSVRFKADRKLKDFINERVGKLSHYYDGLLGGEVKLKLENTDAPENKIAEIRIFVRGNDLFAKKQSSTFEEATDTAVEALMRQLKKYKEKQRG